MRKSKINMHTNENDENTKQFPTKIELEIRIKPTQNMSRYSYYTISNESQASFK